METIAKEVSKVGVHSAISGFASAGVAVAMGSTGSVPIMGINLPVPLIFGAVGALSSGVQKASRDNIIPMLVNDPDVNTVLYILEPLIQGGAFAGFDFALNLLVGNEYGFDDGVTAFVIGGVSSLIASYAQQPVEKYLDAY